MTESKTQKPERRATFFIRATFILIAIVLLCQLAIGPAAFLLERGAISQSTASTLESTVFLPVTFPASRSPTVFQVLKSYISLWESTPPPTANNGWSGPAPVPVKPGETFPPPIDLSSPQSYTLPSPNTQFSPPPALPTPPNP